MKRCKKLLYSSVFHQYRSESISELPSSSIETDSGITKSFRNQHWHMARLHPLTFLVSSSHGFHHEERNEQTKYGHSVAK